MFCDILVKGEELQKTENGDVTRNVVFYEPRTFSEAFKEAVFMVTDEGPPDVNLIRQSFILVKAAQSDAVRYAWFHEVARFAFYPELQQLTRVVDTEAIKRHQKEREQQMKWRDQPSGAVRLDQDVSKHLEDNTWKVISDINAVDDCEALPESIRETAE